MVAELQPLIDKVWRHCDDKGARGRTVTLAGVVEQPLRDVLPDRVAAI
jgi:hypothetical protein